MSQQDATGQHPQSAQQQTVRPPLTLPPGVQLSPQQQQLLQQFAARFPGGIPQSNNPAQAAAAAALFASLKQQQPGNRAPSQSPLNQSTINASLPGSANSSAPSTDVSALQAQLQARMAHMQQQAFQAAAMRAGNQQNTGNIASPAANANPSTPTPNMSTSDAAPKPASLNGLPDWATQAAATGMLGNIAGADREAIMKQLQALHASQAQRAKHAGALGGPPGLNAVGAGGIGGNTGSPAAAAPSPSGAMGTPASMIHQLVPQSPASAASPGVSSTFGRVPATPGSAGAPSPAASMSGAPGIVAGQAAGPASAAGRPPAGLPTRPPPAVQKQQLLNSLMAYYKSTNQTLPPEIFNGERDGSFQLCGQWIELTDLFFAIFRLGGMLKLMQTSNPMEHPVWQALLASKGISITLPRPVALPRLPGQDANAPPIMTTSAVQYLVTGYRAWILGFETAMARSKALQMQKQAGGVRPPMAGSPVTNVPTPTATAPTPEASVGTPARSLSMSFPGAAASPQAAASPAVTAPSPLVTQPQPSAPSPAAAASPAVSVHQQPTMPAVSQGPPITQSPAVAAPSPATAVAPSPVAMSAPMAHGSSLPQAPTTANTAPSPAVAAPSPAASLPPVGQPQQSATVQHSSSNAQSPGGPATAVNGAPNNADGVAKKRKRDGQRDLGRVSASSTPTPTVPSRTHPKRQRYKVEYRPLHFPQPMLGGWDERAVSLAFPRNNMGRPTRSTSELEVDIEGVLMGLRSRLPLEIGYGLTVLSMLSMPRHDGTAAQLPLQQLIDVYHELLDLIAESALGDDGLEAWLKTNEDADVMSAAPTAMSKMSFSELTQLGHDLDFGVEGEDEYNGRCNREQTGGQTDIVLAGLNIIRNFSFPAENQKLMATPQLFNLIAAVTDANLARMPGEARSSKVYSVLELARVRRDCVVILTNLGNEFDLRQVPKTSVQHVFRLLSSYLSAGWESSRMREPGYGPTVSIRDVPPSVLLSIDRALEAFCRVALSDANREVIGNTVPSDELVALFEGLIKLFPLGGRDLEAMHSVEDYLGRVELIALSVYSLAFLAPLSARAEMRSTSGATSTLTRLVYDLTPRAPDLKTSPFGILVRRVSETLGVLNGTVNPSGNAQMMSFAAGGVEGKGWSFASEKVQAGWLAHDRERVLESMGWGRGDGRVWRVDSATFGELDGLWCE